MKLLGQFTRFAAVGLFATIVHVTTAWVLIDLIPINPYIGNLVGAIAAFGVSFGGNAMFTFNTDRRLWSAGRRYILVSLVSLAITSLILKLIEGAGLPTYVFVISVIVTVPLLTFSLAKWWAFQSPLRSQR